MSNRLHTYLSVGLIVASVTAAGCAGNDQRAAKLESSAKAFQSQQQYSEAIIQYRNAVKLVPNVATLHYELGEAYTQNQQYPEAFASFNKALQLQPDYEPAELAVGEFYLVAKQYDKAEGSAQAALQHHPGDVNATILLANIEEARDQGPAALERLTALVQAHDESVAAHLNLGILYAVDGRSPDAQAQFQRAITLQPDSVMAHNDLANLFSSQGNWAGAETVYRADVNQNRNSPEANQALADFLTSRGRYAEAEPLYRSLVTLRHNTPQAQFALASFYYDQGKTADAEAIDRKLASVAPSFLPAREQWARIAAQNKNYAQMNQVLDALLKDKPNDINALLQRAAAQLDQNQPTPALTTLAAARRLNPNLARVAYEEGVAYRELNNGDRAQDSFLQAVELDPRDVDAQSAMAELMLDRGHSDTALNYAHQVQALAPARADGYLFAGNALANLQRLPEAETSFARYAELAPQSSLGPSRLGYVYLMEKRGHESETSFERALIMNPADSEALAGLVACYHFEGKPADAARRIQTQLTLADAAHAPAPALAAMSNQLASAYAENKQSVEAEAALRQSLTLDPHNYNTYAMLGTLLAQKNAFAEAQAQYSRAVAMNPESAGLWTLLGMLDEQLQKPAEAEQAYVRAIAIDPNNGVADNNLAAIYATQPQQLDQALTLAQRAKRALPGVADVSDTLGWIYVNQNVYQAAIPLLREAVTEKPASPDFRVHLATALYRDGRKPEAAAELNAAIRLDKSLSQRPEILAMTH